MKKDTNRYKEDIPELLQLFLVTCSAQKNCGIDVEVDVTCSRLECNLDQNPKLFEEEHLQKKKTGQQHLS